MLSNIGQESGMNQIPEELRRLLQEYSALTLAPTEKNRNRMQEIHKNGFTKFYRDPACKAEIDKAMQMALNVFQ